MVSQSAASLRLQGIRRQACLLRFPREGSFVPLPTTTCNMTNTPPYHSYCYCWWWLLNHYQIARGRISSRRLLELDHAIQKRERERQGEGGRERERAREREKRESLGLSVHSGTHGVDLKITFHPLQAFAKMLLVSPLQNWRQCSWKVKSTQAKHVLLWAQEMIPRAVLCVYHIRCHILQYLRHKQKCQVPWCLMFLLSSGSPVPETIG